MFFFSGASVSCYDYLPEYSKTIDLPKLNFVLYVITICVLWFCSLVLCFLFSSTLALTIALTIAIVVIIYTGWIWCPGVIHDFKNKEPALIKNLTDSLYIRQALNELIALCYQISSDSLTQSIQDLKNISLDELNTNNFTHTLSIINTIMQKTNNISATGDNAEFITINKTKILLQCNNIKNDLSSGKCNVRFIASNMIANGQCNLLNLFLEKTLNIADLYQFLQLWNNTNNEQTIPNQWEKVSAFSNYIIQKSTIDNSILLTINPTKDIKITIIKDNLDINIKKITIATTTQTITIPFWHNFPIVQTVSGMFLLTNFGTIQIQNKDKKYSIIGVSLASQIALDNIYKYNQIIGDDYIINLNKNNIIISCASKQITIDSSNRITVV